MTLRIGHNVEAHQAHRHLSAANDRLAVAMRRLSSGLRINSAKDDAAGLGISERMRSQIRGLEQANRNVQDGISMLNTMEGALETVHSILQRAREIAVQFNNGTYSNADRIAMMREMIALCTEVARIEQSTTFNGMNLLQVDGAVVTLQVGANAGDEIPITMIDLFGAGPTAFVRPATFFVSPWGGADIAGIDAHIADIASARAYMGATVNRLEHTLSVNQAMQESYMAAESRIRDADIAQEMAEVTRQRVLIQSSTAMLAHANASRSRILDLLR